jgi:hypothetical protein
VQAAVLPGLGLGAGGARASVGTATGVRQSSSGAFDPVLRSVNAAAVELETKNKTDYNTNAFLIFKKRRYEIVSIFL